MNYPSGAASLFSSIARQPAIKTRCEWCAEQGGIEGSYVGGFFIPTGHTDCANNARLASAECRCYEFVGDNNNCSVHGDGK